MPTLTTIALQNLVEHRTSSHNSSTLNNPQTTHIQTSNANRRLDVFEVQSGGNGEEKMLESCLFDSDDDGFADARCDSVSIASSIDDVDDDFGRLGFEDMSVVSNQIGDYYDAVQGKQNVVFFFCSFMILKCYMTHIMTHIMLYYPNLM
ncbi:hypothetical protein Hanom_Chr06g00531361 [Helianthus anomalus]